MRGFPCKTLCNAIAAAAIVTTVAREVAHGPNIPFVGLAEGYALYAIRAFVLTSKNLTARGMAQALITHKSRIQAEAFKPAPALFAVTTSSIREIDLTP